MDLTGKVALVTGGAAGVGRATAERFIEVGARGVAIADVREDDLRAATAQLAALRRGDVLAVPTDVSRPEQVDALVQATLERFGRIDILVNNAGICPVISWHDATLDDWNRILAVNLTGMYLCTRAVIPHMQAQKWGRIVYMSSPAAFSGSIVAHAGYGVSKAGIIALMKSVAKAFGADGILANAIAPGPIDTPMGHSFGEDYYRATEQRTVLKRHATAREMADAVLFLVSENSTFVTGHVLWVDGGYSLT